MATQADHPPPAVGARMPPIVLSLCGAWPSTTVGMALADLVSFWRMSRPVFLLGGAALFALGAGIAHAQGSEIQPAHYLLAQLFVTSVQLMTQYLNEYWDIEADRLNQSRTFFSGGSGVLPAGLLWPRTALLAAVVTIAVASAAALAIILLGISSPLAVFLMVAMFFGAFFYSSPPLALAATGWGELVASVVVAGLVPAFGLVVLGGTLSMTLVVVVSLVALHFAMMLAFEIPDEPSDRAANKRTLVVRIGLARAAQLHNAALVAGILLGIVAPLALGIAHAALPALVVAPLALWQANEVRRLARGQIVPLGRVTTAAVAIFALTAAALAAVFWSV